MVHLKEQKRIDFECSRTQGNYAIAIAIVMGIVISEMLLSFVLVVNANRRVVLSLAKRKA